VYGNYTEVFPGDPIRAEDINKIARLASMRGGGIDTIVDRWGVHQIPPIPETEETPSVILGQLTEDLDTTDTTFQIDGIQQVCGQRPFDEADESGSPSALTVTVYNIFSWEGSEDGYCMAIWQGSEERWLAVQVECP